MAGDGVERRGLMFVLSSPSGAGKTTLSRMLLDSVPGLEMSVSVTTRRKRQGEIDGRDYRFIDVPRFRQMVNKDQLLEHAKVFDNFYGTPRDPVEEALRSGRDVLFDIDWQGTQQLRKKARKDVVSVFILPPSANALVQRLHTRAQDSEDVIQGRMKKAASEMSHWKEYGHIVVNENVGIAFEAVKSILIAARLERKRQTGMKKFVSGLRRQLEK
jgi:guanylate kinase